MNRITIILFISLQINILQAQTLKGIIKDESNAPIVYANVLLFDADSVLVKGVVSDLHGNFFINQIKSGKYYLQIRFIGYETQTIPSLNLFNEELILPDIILKSNQTQLKEIVIKAEKPIFEQKIDKLVVNVDQQLTSVGGNVLDILERSPGVSVNRQSGTMALSGKQGVQVMINGKLQRLPLNMVMQQLEGMPSIQIQKIELITNPSAAFDAEGDAGIIKIITKKSDEQGITGNITGTLGYGTYTGYFKPNVAVNLTYKFKQNQFYFSYSGNFDRRWQQWNYEREIFNPQQYSNTISDRYVRWPIQRAQLGADLELSKKTKLSLLTSAFSNVWKMQAFNNSITSINGIDSAQILLSDKETNDWRHVMFSAQVEHQLNDKTQISLDADYLYYYDDNPNYFVNDYYVFQTQENLREEVRISKKTPINMGVLKADLERQFGKTKLEAGTKLTFSNLENRIALENLINEDWISDPLFTQNYQLDDNVIAAYANIQTQVNEKAQLQAGLRTESTDMIMSTNTSASLFKLKFWSLFPTVFYTYKMNENSTWQISYGRRITRPGYTDVAPFVIFMDPFTYYWGNPKLKPTLSDGIQVNYSYKDLLINIRYSYDKNAIVRNQSRFNESDKKTYIYSDNVDELNLISFSTTLPAQILPWWKIQTNTIFTWQRINHRYNNKNLMLDQSAIRVNANQQFKLSKTLQAEINAVYVSPRRIGLSKLKEQADISVAIQKTFKNSDKLSLAFSDVFWTTKAFYVANQPELLQDQTTSYINEPRILRLTFSHAVGNKKLKVAKQRNTASDAEQQRVN